MVSRLMCSKMCSWIITNVYQASETQWSPLQQSIRIAFIEIYRRSTIILPLFWQEVFGKNGETLAVSFDISKAFDRVWHQALLSKLPSFGFDSSLVSLIENFLQCRTIAVTIDGTESDSFPLDYGVPQGSVLSHTLFHDFINDSLNLTSNNLVLFAADCTLFVTSGFEKSPTSRMHSNSREKNDLISGNRPWLHPLLGMKNFVEANPKKTQLTLSSLAKRSESISISFQGCKIPSSSNLNIVGTTLNTDLSWKSHINNVAKNALKLTWNSLERQTIFFLITNLAEFTKDSFDQTLNTAATSGATVVLSRSPTN